MSEVDDNIETIEDFIIEEIVEPIYSFNVKQEMDIQSEEKGFEIISENNSYDDIVCIENGNTKTGELYHCALCDITFTSVEQHLKENHNTTEVVQYEEYDYPAKINQNNTETNENNFSKRNDTELEKYDIGCQKNEVFINTIQNIEPRQRKTEDLSSSILENQEESDEHCEEVEIKEEHIASIFSCPFCPKTFSVISMLQKHQKSHKKKQSQIKKIKNDKMNDDIGSELNHCVICNTTFTSSKNLKLHSKMHLKIQTKSIKDAMPVGAGHPNDKNQFYCEICNKSFDQTLLSVHQNMHQNVEELNCSICNRQFENQVSYDMHMQLHADQPTRVRVQQVLKPGARFSCNYCGKEFLRPHEKVKHERIHTGEKPHECEVCGKSFRVSYSLTLHLRTHTDVRPFVCAQCNKRFKSYAVYSHHLNTHSEERPYKCPMCPKSFRTSVQLCGHKNSHTKPYNCPECNRPFSSLYAVKMHMKTHNKANKSNENLKHRCGMCGAVYARMFALRFHMKEQHSTDLIENQEKIDENNGVPGASSDECFNEDEVSTHAILQEEIIIDSFQPEEIVTDW